VYLLLLTGNGGFSLSGSEHHPFCKNEWFTIS